MGPLTRPDEGAAWAEARRRLVLRAAQNGRAFLRRLRRRGDRRFGAAPWALALLLLALGGLLFGDARFAPPARALDSTIDLTVLDAQSGDPIPYFKWMVNLDNSHDNASLMAPASYSPVVASGDQDNASGISLPYTVAPDRGYLVSVYANDGVGTLNGPDYKIGGTHFSIPDTDGQVVVELQPNPLPLSTLKIKVFHDNAPVNGEEDLAVEEGLEGFHVTLRDRIGEVTTDWFGNPLCTEYLDFPGGTPSPGTGGFCATGADGWATIENMGPDRYEVETIPPDGSDWIQTSTIEGTLANDAWVVEGADGFSVEGQPNQGIDWKGFVRLCSFGDPTDDCTSETADTAGKTGKIIGRARTIVLDSDVSVFQMGTGVDRPYVALTSLDGNDEQVWTGRGNPDGTFTVPDVPAGQYQLAIWDKPLDYVIQFVSARVTADDCVGDLTPCTVDLGDVPMPRWFGTIRGSVYVDQNQNGVRDPEERGLPRQDLDTRFKDGTIQYATFSDSNGNYEFPEVFELEHFAIAEVGYGRFKNTGAAAYRTDDFGNPIDYPWVDDCTDIDGTPVTPPVTPCTPGSSVRECTDASDWRTCEHGPINQDLGLAGLLQAEITWGGTTNYIDWGKKPFAPGENGGIVGIAFNAVTRNELNARLQAAEDYEPGVPGTVFNLYAALLDGPERGAQCVGAGDEDGDGVVNDGCPAAGPGAPETLCDNAIDDDGDGVVNDGCPAAGPGAPETLCDNIIDDDSDAVVNDGCPQVGLFLEVGTQCDNATNDDGDQVDIIDGKVDVNEDAAITADDDLSDQILNLSPSGTDQVDIIDGKVDVNEDGAITADDDLSDAVLNLSPSGTDQVDLIDGEVDVDEDAAITADDDLSNAVLNDEAVVNDGCPPAGAPAPESGTQCDNAVDDDGDSVVNDGCPPAGAPVPEAGTQCDNALDDDGDGAVNDGCPVAGPFGNPMYDPVTGEILKDHLANVYAADSWYDNLPTDCIPVGTLGRDPTEVQPPNIWADCLELPSIMTQVKPGVFDGGYAFEEDCSNPVATGADKFDPTQLLDAEAGNCVILPAGKWVVEAVPPDGYNVVKEEDINVFSGDVFVPQVPPPPCAGPKHTVHVTDIPADADFDPNNPSITMGVYNPDFLATTSPLAPAGGSPYEGQEMPLCNQRLIDLKSGFNANSDFFIFNEVPQPGRIRGVLLDDLTLELDPSSPLYGEKRGIPNAPVGIRDFSGKLITTVYSDENGSWEVLLPSTGTYNCPLPAGPCPGMYEVIGNDPGDLAHPNDGWNPNYGTLRLVFDVWPATTTYADVAIVPIATFVQSPGAQLQTTPACDIPTGTPDILSVSQPYGPAGADFDVDITGSGFTGATATLDGTDIPTIVGSAASITATIPGTATPGPHQLLVTNNSGATSPSGITIHVLDDPDYNPPLVHVDVSAPDGGDGNPATPFNVIQDAIDAADDGDLILVHPGVYYESIIVDEKVKLQGYGPDATLIDGRFVSLADFEARLGITVHGGPTDLPVGQVVSVLPEVGEFDDAGYNAQIDGFTIRGGQRTLGRGGGIYLHAYARYLEVSNNLVQSNAGVTGGGIILGGPHVTNPDAGNALDNENDFVRIHHNRVLNNGSMVLGSGIVLFNGAEDYEIDHNVICGNYSAEYGGGISNWGYSSGTIHDNDILFNYAFDEGGGVMVAGEIAHELGQPGTGLSAGTGPITIERNLIQGNISNDDGGGVRLLQPVEGHVRIVNNMIVDNLATDTGGGIALDDALHVDIVNNTVVRNISTATAEDADRSSCSPLPYGTCPHGAGLVSEPHSAALMAAIVAGAFDCGAVNCASGFSDPVLFNNIFWQNEAFNLDGTTGLLGGGLPSAGYLDFEVLGGGGNFSSAYSDCTAFTPDCPVDGTNIDDDPLVMQEVGVDFDALAFTGDPSFITIVINSVPGDPQGDYHLQVTSPAINVGIGSIAGVDAPSDDFDGDVRPDPACAPDMGADEVVPLPNVTVVCGGTASTGSDATSSDPVTTTVNVPPGAASQNATLSIVETTEGPLPPSGFTFLGQQVNISVTPGTTFGAPVTVEFRIDSSLLPVDPSTVELFKDGSLVLDCTGDSGTTTPPDPCVASKLVVDGDLVIIIKTTTFSMWAFGVPVASDGTPPPGDDDTPPGDDNTPPPGSNVRPPRGTGHHNTRGLFRQPRQFPRTGFEPAQPDDDSSGAPPARPAGDLAASAGDNRSLPLVAVGAALLLIGGGGIWARRRSAILATQAQIRRRLDRIRKQYGSRGSRRGEDR